MNDICFYYVSDLLQLFRYFRHLAIRALLNYSTLRAFLLHISKSKAKKLQKLHSNWVKSVTKLGVVVVIELAAVNRFKN